MNAERAKEIHQAKDLSKYTRKECEQADKWLKDYAMKALQPRLNNLPRGLKEYTLLMVKCHYGSVETDQFLREMGCYPLWVGGAA